MVEKYCLAIDICRSIMNDIIMLLIIVILCFLLILLYAIFVGIPKAFHIHKFKKQNNIESLIPLIDEQLEEYNKLFAPNRFVSDDEVKKFLSDNVELIHCVSRLYTSIPSIYNDYLDSTNIKTYRELITLYNIHQHQKKNNVAYSRQIQTPVAPQNPISGFQRTSPLKPETTGISDELPF